MSNIAAFFDLDRTLIDVNSGLLWAKHERREGNITLKQFGQAAFWTALYHLSLIDMDKAYNAAIGHYRGQPYETLDQRTQDWFHKEVHPLLRSSAVKAIQDHKSQGHHLVMLTSSSCFQAAIASETWGFDHWLANIFPTDPQGMLTGTFEAPLCYGEGKVTRAEAWAKTHNVDLNQSYFYSDSLTDLPMLERVGEPRVVTPDPRLKKLAQRRHWPILAW